MNSILQDWVMELGLRHQGVLVSSIRGCDTVSRDAPIKLLCRVLRAMILNCYCGDVGKSQSYIELPKSDEVERRMAAVAKDHDALPHHYLMHLIHAAEIIGYKYPKELGDWGQRWKGFYHKMCNKMHMEPESENAMDNRLNASEEQFKANQ